MVMLLVHPNEGGPEKTLFSVSVSVVYDNLRTDNSSFLELSSLRNITRF